MRLKKALAVSLVAGILGLNFAPLTAVAVQENSDASVTKVEKQKKLSRKEKKALEEKQNKINYINIEWWENYNDPYLTEYIYKALANNKDLKIATLKVEESRQATKAQLANELPSFSVGASPLLFKASESTKSQGSFAVPMIASYEADIFLKNRDKTRSAKKLYEASQLQEKATYITIAGEVGATYYNIVKLDKLIELQEELIKDRKQIYELMKVSNDEGIVSTSDLVQADKAYVIACSDLIDLQKAREIMLNALAVLVGESPANIATFKRISFDEINDNRIIPESISSETITARPDYLVAQKLVEKAGIDVRVAKKEFLPTIDILGLLSFSTSSVGSSFGWKSAVAGVGGSALLPLFTGGAKMANFRINKNRYEQTLLNYEKTNLTAIQEVNDSLSVLKLDNEKHLRNLSTLEIEQKDFGFAENKYEQGVISYLDLLQKKEALLVMKKMVAASKSDCLVNHISLYKAVAGNLE